MSGITFLEKGSCFNFDGHQCFAELLDIATPVAKSFIMSENVSPKHTLTPMDQQAANGMIETLNTFTTFLLHFLPFAKTLQYINFDLGLFFPLSFYLLYPFYY